MYVLGVFLSELVLFDYSVGYSFVSLFTCPTLAIHLSLIFSSICRDIMTLFRPSNYSGSVQPGRWPNE